MRYYIDCEFDGHNGPLLSIAMVGEDGFSLYLTTTETATDPWVIENVVPHLGKHSAHAYAQVASDRVGRMVLDLLARETHPVIVADSPVDIARFCRAISTSPDGDWQSAEFPRMTFEVHNVNCYPSILPSAVQHNAYWDAMSLMYALAAREGYESQ